jgi:uncharacterized protein (TIGR00369 family)
MPIPSGAKSYFDWMRGVMEGRFEPAPVARQRGFRFTKVERREVTMEMDADERHANPMGTIHGGVVLDLLDAALGCAFATTLRQGETSTLFQLNCNFLRPAWKTTLTASARLVSRGRNVGVTECDVTDSEGRLIARATATCTVLRDRQAENR